MATQLITVADLEERLQRTVNGVQAVALIEDASALIEDAAGGYDFTGGVPAGIVPVVVRVVDRAISNPLGLDSETLGSHSWTKQSAGAPGGVYLTRDDVRAVRRAVGKLGVGTAVLEGDLPRSIGRTDVAAAESELTGTL